MELAQHFDASRKLAVKHSVQMDHSCPKSVDVARLFSRRAGYILLPENARKIYSVPFESDQGYPKNCFFFFQQLLITDKGAAGRRPLPKSTIIIHFRATLVLRHHSLDISGNWRTRLLIQPTLEQNTASWDEFSTREPD
jgi:hypothetical protein